MSRDVDLDQLLEDPREGFTGGPKKRIPGLRAFLGILVIVTIGLVMYGVWSMRQITAAEEPAAETKGRQANALPRYEMATSAAATAPEAGGQTAVAQAPQAPAAPPKRWGPQPTGQRTHAEDPYQAAMAARLSGSSDVEQTQESQPASPGKKSSLQTSENSTAYASRLKSERMESTRAVMMQNQSLTVASGTMIPCGTWTELDTTVPGQVACRTTREVWSVDQKVKLIDKGAYVEGQVSGGIKFGQARVFVLWTRVRNRDGAMVYLDSPGTNRLGSAGVVGQVDNHFWERFRDAGLISIFSDGTKSLFQMLANSTNNSETNVNLDNTENTSDSLAREALQATIGIPPTLYTANGEYVQIMVARDIDFSDVYELRTK